MPFVLQTPRLHLREMSDDDLDFIATLIADPEVMRYYPRCYTREEAVAWVRRQRDRYSRDGHGLWLVMDKATGEPIGQVGLIAQTVDGIVEPEIGYMIHRSFWRRGFASEAAVATRDHAFGVLHKPYVISLIRPENVPSQGVARKLGMMPQRRTVFAGFDHLIFTLANPGGPVSAAPGDV